MQVELAQGLPDASCSFEEVTILTGEAGFRLPRACAASSRPGLSGTAWVSPGLGSGF